MLVLDLFVVLGCYSATFSLLLYTFFFCTLFRLLRYNFCLQIFLQGVPDPLFLSFTSFLIIFLQFLRLPLLQLLPQNILRTIRVLFQFQKLLNMGVGHIRVGLFGHWHSNCFNLCFWLWLRVLIDCLF